MFLFVYSILDMNLLIFQVTKNIYFSEAKNLYSKQKWKTHLLLMCSHVVQSVIIWGGASNTKINKVRVALNKILRVIIRVKTENFHVLLLGSNEMYVMLELLKFDDILYYCLIKFINWCFTKLFDMFHTYFVQIIPQHAHQVCSPKLNYPPTKLEVHRQSTIFQCVRIFNRLHNLFCITMSSYQLKKTFKRHILGGYQAGWMLISFSPSLIDDLRGAVDG